MKVGERHFRSIWPDEQDQKIIWIIDQRKLPFSFEFLALTSVTEVCAAISGMAVRGAPLIGVTAAWGIYLSLLEHRTSEEMLSYVHHDADMLKATRPTAVNLAWAVDFMMDRICEDPSPEAVRKAVVSLADSEVESCRRTGQNGLPLIEEASSRKGGAPVNILTHCNAGWLACVDYGTALAPVYLAHDRGIKVHVWVDETRPRNQGSRLTAWELSNHGVPCTLITDNAGGHLMQKGMVDMVIVGCDRATAGGDVANKIGTYLKALAAYDNNIPFYSAFPVSSIDLSMNYMDDIPVEERDADEVRIMEGIPADVKNEATADGQPTSVYICRNDTPVSNFGFDITPARLLTGLITDRGICRADRKSIIKMLS
ncbi:MAG TPA: S-methyl-5-thioribose-1-phosphate isomerase [Bacteroidales bacterium]|nr:S-methyl-5-thioribose-1-phosphate isomerase [Bacteroidales bacterium]